MKKILLSVALIAASFTMTAQVGIDTTTPKASLDVTGAKGILLSRIADHTTLVPVDGTLDANEKGLQVYNTTTNKVMLWDGTTWVVGGAGGKWVDDGFGNIVLDNGVTAKDSIKYSSKGFSFVDKTNPTIAILDVVGGTYSHTDITDLNSYNKQRTLSSNIEINNASNTIYFNSTDNIIDAADTNVSKRFFGSNTDLYVATDNANNYQVILGGALAARHNGTGTVTNLRGSTSVGSLGLNSTATRVWGALNTAAHFSSNSVNELYGTDSQVTVRGNGNVGLINVSRSNFNRGSIPVSSTIGEVRMFTSTVSLGADFSGTITNYYDFYSPAVDPGSGTITNQYGIAIDGGDKTNYLSGKLAVGHNSPNQTLDVFDATNTIASRFRTINNGIAIDAKTVNGAANESVSIRLQNRASVGFDGTRSGLLLSDAGANKHIIFDTASTERMRIANTTGFVGIGTASPASQLHVNGAVIIGDSTSLPVVGMMRYNSGSDTFEGYVNDTGSGSAGWIALH